MLMIGWWLLIDGRRHEPDFLTKIGDILGHITAVRFIEANADAPDGDVSIHVVKNAINPLVLLRYINFDPIQKEVMVRFVYQT